ncbi:hypothetical protein HDU76_001789 [Blyttiomyces sp. JEL0837]|nr:hypothetical protein HDU76_001789 [Blyttiomyces sp. JEL0837]
MTTTTTSRAATTSLSTTTKKQTTAKQTSSTPPSLPCLLTPTDLDNLSRSLFFYRRVLSRKEFWSDTEILDRIHYKNKNQHKSSVQFRKMDRGRRLLKWLKTLDVVERINDTLKIMNVTGKKARKKEDVIVAPDAETVETLLRAVRTSHTHMQTVNAYRSQAGMTYFMSLSLTVMAILSRLYVLGEPMIKELKDFYIFLRRDIIKLEAPSSWRDRIARDYPDDLENESNNHSDATITFDDYDITAIKNTATNIPMSNTNTPIVDTIPMDESAAFDLSSQFFGESSSIPVKSDINSDIEPKLVQTTDVVTEDRTSVNTNEKKRKESSNLGMLETVSKKAKKGGDIPGEEILRSAEDNIEIVNEIRAGVADMLANKKRRIEQQGGDEVDVVDVAVKKVKSTQDSNKSVTKATTGKKPTATTDEIDNLFGSLVGKKSEGIKSKSKTEASGELDNTETSDSKEKGTRKPKSQLFDIDDIFGNVVESKQKGGVSKVAETKKSKTGDSEKLVVKDAIVAKNKATSSSKVGIPAKFTDKDNVKIKNKGSMSVASKLLLQQQQQPKQQARDKQIKVSEKGFLMKGKEVVKSGVEKAGGKSGGKEVKKMKQKQKQ